MTKTTSNPIVEVKDLRKHFGDVHAVDGLSFEVNKGEIFGVLGPNGAGKTTTMEIIVGLQKQTSGGIRVLGKDTARDEEELKQRIGVQLQTVNLFPRLTVKETLSLFASFYNNPLDVDIVIDMVELGVKKNAKIMTLSGGQLRRVAFGNAIIGNGDIIFLDEPTSGLDPQSKQSMWSLIGDLRDKGKTIFMTTHFMEEAQNLCSRVCIIDHGKIIDMDTPYRLIKKHFKETAVEICHPLRHLKQQIEMFDEVGRLSILDDSTKIYTNDVPVTISKLLGLFRNNGKELRDIRIRESNLEDVFLKTTGRRIRE